MDSGDNKKTVILGADNKNDTLKDQSTHTKESDSFQPFLCGSSTSASKKTVSPRPDD